MPVIGILSCFGMMSSFADGEVKSLGYDTLINTGSGTLVQSAVFDLEVTAENPVIINEIQFQIRGGSASTWDFIVYFREGSLADEINGIPVHRLGEAWDVVGQALAVPSPPSSGKHPVTLNMGPADGGGLALSEGRYSFYFASLPLENSVTGNGLRVVNPNPPLEGNPPFFQPFDVILENADMRVLLGGSKGSPFGSTNPLSNLRSFGQLEFIYTGGDVLDPPPADPDPVDLIVGSPDFTYTQDFNSLGNVPKKWINSGTLPGWHLFVLEDASFSMDGRDLPATGSALRRTYLNFGFTETERALGATAGSSYLGISEVSAIATGDTFGFITLALKNETGGVIDSLALSYDGLQFELGNSNAGPQEISVAHAASSGTVPSDPTAWTEVPEINFSSPRFTGPANTQEVGLLNPFMPENRANRVAGDLTGLGWQPGDTLWVRWRDINASGGDHGLLIDNVSVNLTQSLEWNAGSWVADGFGGSGSWSDGSGNWQSDKVAIFKGTSGSVAVGDVTATRGLRFLSGNFLLGGGSLALTGALDSGNLIHVEENSSVNIQSTFTAANGFAKTGEGTLTLSGLNTISGRSSIHAGKIIADIAALGGDFDVRGVLDLTNNSDVIHGHVISGSGEVEKRGTGTLTLTNASAFFGEFSILDGILRGAPGNLPSGSIRNNTTLIIDESGSDKLSALISGTGQLVKTGIGFVRLTRDNTYAGGTTINGGTLIIDGVHSGASSNPTSVVSGAAFGGSGTLRGPVAASAGSRILPGGEDSIGTFTMFDGGTVEGVIEIDFDTFDSDRIRVFSGSIDISAATLDLRLATGATPSSEVYTILEIGSGAGITGTFAQVLGIPEGYTVRYDMPNQSVALVSDLVPSGAFANWIAGFEGIDPTLRGPFADADGSGTVNVLEFVLNGDPTNPSSNGLFAIWMSTNSPGNPLRFTIAVPVGTTFEASPTGQQVAMIDGYGIRVEAGSDLEEFDLQVLHLSTANLVPQSGLPSLESTNWEYHTFGLNGANGKAFIRLRVSE